MIYLISDTHFNHLTKMVEYCNRPKNSEEKILKALSALKAQDILIHLGDICIGNDLEVHNMLRQYIFKKILVKGNHDKKSNAWYYEHGWDFVCKTFQDKFFGLNILFSHKPYKDTGYDLNIHGHFHNNEHRSLEPELVAIKNSKQRLFVLENELYRPVPLATFITRNGGNCG